MTVIDEIIHNGKGRPSTGAWRSYVPSERQGGVEIAPPERPLSARPPVPPTLAKPPWWRAFFGQFAALSPRAIASKGGSPLPVMLFAVISVLEACDVASFGILIILIKGEMHFDFTALLTLISSLTFARTIVAPLSGYLVDRYKRVTLVRVGAIIARAGTFLTAIAPGPGTLVGARLMVGVGPGIEQPATVPLLTDYYPIEARAAAFGFLAICTQLGGAVAGIGVYVIALTIGVPWRVIMMTLALLSLLVTGFLFLLREPERGAGDRMSLGLTGPPPDLPPPPKVAEAWRICAANHTIRRLWLATPFLTVAQSSIGVFLFFVMRDRVNRGEVSGAFTSVFQNPNAIYVIAAIPLLISMIVTSIGTGIAEKLVRVNPGKIMVMQGLILAFQAMAFLSFAVSPITIVCILSSWMAAGLGGLLIPAQQLVVTSVIPARIRGQGLQSTAPFQVLGLICLPVVGAFADNYSPAGAVYLLISVFLLGAFVTATAGGSVRKDIANALAASAAERTSLDARLRGIDKLIVCRKLEVAYGGTTILRGVDLEVDRGELVGLLGTNGAGKSTLLKALCGLTTPAAGAIYSSGEDVTHKPAFLSARSGVLYVPGGRAVFPSMTVDENLRAAQGLGMATDEQRQARRARVTELFPILVERSGTRAGDLSGGEQQMLALGQALLMRPRLLMIDELSLGLAPPVVERLLDVVREIHAAGTTVLLVEQSVNVAVSIADRIVYMDRGEILFDGTTDRFLARPDLVKAAYLGGAAVRMDATAGTRDDALPVLQCRDLAVTYGGIAAVQGIGFDVLAGEVVGVIGPNGAGKTSLIDLISGHVMADAGSVIVDTTDVTHLGPDVRARLGVGRAFQSARLFTSLSVRENIAAALDRRLDTRSAAMAAAWLPQARQSERRAHKRVERLIDQFGLQTFAEKFVSELSTGSRRLVELACMAAFAPRVLLLDEPSTGLAQAEVEELGPVIRRLGADTGAATVLIEHDLPLLMAVADRVVALELGRVIAIGTPAEVMSDPNVVRAYLSASDGAVHRSGSVRQDTLRAALASALPPPTTASEAPYAHDPVG